MILKNGKRIDGCADTLPVGTVQPFLGLTPPKGYLLCQGQAVSKAVYSELYAICGDLFGQSTDTEFFLPDLRGKTIAGYNENDGAMNTIGKLLGSGTHVHTTGNHTLTPNEIPDHQHYLYYNAMTSGDWKIISASGVSKATQAGDFTKTSGVADYSTGQAHSHGNTGEAANYQPTIVLNWIVKAAMLIPEYFLVENTLTSTSSSNALSAAQGRILNEKLNACYPRSGGTLKGAIECEDGYPHLTLRSTELLYNSTPTYTQYPCVLWTDKNNVPMGRLEMIAATDGSRYMSLYTIAPGYDNAGNFFKIGWNTNGEAVSTLDGDFAIQKGLTIGGSMTVPAGFYRDYEWEFNMYLANVDEWYDTGITGNMFSEGAYLMTAYIGSYQANSQFSEGFAGIVWWYPSTTNDGNAHEIPMSRSGHASNGHEIRFRLARTYGGGYVRLQMADSRAWTGEGSVRIKMKKLM